MSTVTALTEARLPERNLIRDYLHAILKNCECNSSSIRVISNPLFTGIVYNVGNSLPDSDIYRLNDRLKTSATFGIIFYNKGNIYTITGDGLTSSPMLQITHFDRKLLPYALKQEITFETTEMKTVDLCAWTDLPKIIQSHWSRFNDNLRTHIIDCMMAYLQERSGSGLNPSHLLYSNTLFSPLSHRRFPNIPVTLPPGNEVRDLMDVLVSQSRLNFIHLMPAAKAAEELRIRINTATTPLSRRFP